MAKRASEQRLAKFRRDAEKLKEKYSNEELAKKLGVNPANFSSYCTGAKNPGVEFLDKFYSIFGDELKEAGNSNYSENDFANDVNEPEAEIRFINGDDKDDHLHTLKVNNAHFRHTNDKLTASNLELAKSTRQLAKSNYILARNNQYMVLKGSPRRFKQNKPPKPE